MGEMPEGAPRTGVEDLLRRVRALTLIAEQFALDGKLTVTVSQFDNAFETVERMRDSAFAMPDQVGTK